MRSDGDRIEAAALLALKEYLSEERRTPRTLMPGKLESRREGILKFVEARLEKIETTAGCASA